MTYIEEHFDEIYSFKTWEDIKDYKLPKFVYATRMTKYEVKERADNTASRLILNIYLTYKKIKLWLRRKK